MKSKVIITLMILTLSTSALLGCGKSRKERLSEEYQQYFGMTEDEADAMAEAFSGAYEEEGGVDSEVSKERAYISELEQKPLTEVAPEIASAAISDNLYQVYGAVIPTDGSVTLREAIDLIQAGTDFNIHTTTQEGAVKSGIEVSSHSICDESGGAVCKLMTMNLTEGPSDVFEQVIVGVEPGYGIHLLNCFLPSGVVTCYENDYPKNDVVEAARVERIEKMGGDIRYDSIEEFAYAHGVESLKKSSNLSWYSETITDTPIVVDENGDEYYKKVRVTFGYQESTGNMSEVDRTEDILKEGSWWTLYDIELNDLSDEVVAATAEAVREEFLADIVYGDSLGELEFVKLSPDTDGRIYAVYINNGNEYVAMPVGFDYYVGEGIVPKPSGSWYNDRYATLTELEEKYELVNE